MKWFPFEYERSEFILFSPTPGVKRKCAEKPEVSEGCRDEIYPIYEQEFASRREALTLTNGRDICSWRRATIIRSIKCWVSKAE